MATWKPDPTFYASPRHAMEAPEEKLAYVVMLAPVKDRPDAVGVVDVDPDSATYGQLVGRTDMPYVGDEFHHFGWNACSSCLAPYAPHAHVERRYLVVPGLHSSRLYILDTRPDPRSPHIVKIIEPEEVAEKSGYAFLHTVHCGPDGVYVNALGNPEGDGPGGILRLDHETFEIEGAWEKERGDQYLAYDFAWHLGHDTVVTSEWATPNMLPGGLDPEILLAGEYGHRLHFWDLRRRTLQQSLDLGADQQMVLELRPARDPRKAYGFACVVISLEDLSAAIWLWYREGTNGTGEWKAKKVITIPAEPADPELLPPFLKAFGAVPPLVTDLNLSLDDSTLLVSCWGTGELRQYDVTDPFEPVFTGSVRMGGIVGRTPHPSRPDVPLNGGSQMVELSRDGKRAYVTNSLYSPVDPQFYPDGIEGWMVKVDVRPGSAPTLDPDFLLEFEDGLRGHQVRLQGGDASSDSFCYAS